MGLMGKASGNAARQLAPKALGLAPDVTSSFVREALHRAIAGVGPLPPAAEAAEAQLREQDGDVEKAVKEIIANHVRYAGAEGFLTNIGGLVTVAVAIPANMAALAMIECRMVAAIAHLRGYDLDDPRVRNAILVCILGQEMVDKLVRKKKLPAPPMAIATAPHHAPHLDRVIAAEVATDVIARITGKRLATTVGRRVPIVGGLVGLSADAWVTWKIGRYASAELRPRASR